MDDAAFTTVYGAKRLILVGIADVLVIAQLCISMFVAHDKPDMTSTFMTWFFAMFVPTLVATIIGLRVLRKKYGSLLPPLPEVAPAAVPATTNA